MPAGRGVRCEDCYWKGLLEKRIAICQAGLGNTLADDFEAFGRWLEARRGANVAAIRINKYFAFFQDMDAEWGCIPDYKKLIVRFHAEGLRRVRSVIRWMEDAGRIEVDEKVREEDSERRRIREIGERLDSSTEGGRLWNAFREIMKGRFEEGKTSLRSARMVLSAAADLVLRAEGNVPTQLELDAYLLDKPGQKANITGFVYFINEAQGISLMPQTDERRVKERSRVNLEHQLIVLMKKPEDTLEFRRKWARLAVRYFHGCPAPRETIIRDALDGGLVVCSGGKEYWIPLPDTACFL